MTRIAVDTSATIPYLMRSHESHDRVRRALSQYELVLTGHSLAETYSVLTRLPGDARLAPSDAVTLLDANFGQPVLPAQQTTCSLPAELASHGIAGGAVYDALVGLAARDARLGLATRDRRAANTYSALGLTFTLLPG
jgi:predicted nucleic acid-binding protein